MVRPLPLAVLLARLATGAAFKIVPIPRFHIDELTVDDFDNRFLNQEPVILTGATTCPLGVGFDDLRKHCWGEVGHRVRRKITGNESDWAGLTNADIPVDMQIVDFIENMGKSNDSNPLFAFDVQLPKYCPALITKVHIPPHLATIFQSQFQYRHMWDIDYRKCVSLPFYNSYLAEAGFQSDMHIDAAHTSFTASMCEGQKRWRIFTAQNMSAFEREFSDQASKNLTFSKAERSFRGVLPKMQFRSPFDTWSSASPMTDKPGLVVFEGTLSPGEIIYIPGGAPHAAITLSKSWMVASNDQTLLEAKEIQEVCRRNSNFTNYSSFCNLERKMNQSLRNYELYGDKVTRAAMSFLESNDCKNAAGLDRARNMHDMARELTLVTPDNLYNLLADGPLLVVKLGGTDYWSASLRPLLPQMPARFNPRLRVAIVCDGKCIRTPVNSSELIVSDAPLESANGIYAWHNDTLFMQRDGGSTIFFDEFWKLSVEGHTFGPKYDFMFTGGLDRPEEYGLSMSWPLKAIAVEGAEPDIANGVYQWAGNDTYVHNTSQAKIVFDQFWKLKIGDNVANEEHDFQWKWRKDLNGSMTWFSRDGHRTCTANVTQLAEKGARALVVQVGLAAWDALLDDNSVNPEFMVVKPAQRGLVRYNKTLNFTIDYFYGLRNSDVIMTWAALMTGSEVSGLPLHVKLAYLVYNSICWLLSLPIKACGYKAYTDGIFKFAPGIQIPDGGNIAAVGIAVVVAVVLLLSTCCCMRFCRKQHKAKDD